MPIIASTLHLISKTELIEKPSIAGSAFSAFTCCRELPQRRRKLPQGWQNDMNLA
jgi:hypothetical protein